MRDQSCTCVRYLTALHYTANKQAEERNFWYTPLSIISWLAKQSIPRKRLRVTAEQKTKSRCPSYAHNAYDWDRTERERLDLNQSFKPKTDGSSRQSLYIYDMTRHEWVHACLLYPCIVLNFIWEGAQHEDIYDWKRWGVYGTLR